MGFPSFVTCAGGVDVSKVKAGENNNSLPLCLLLSDFGGSGLVI